MVDKTIKPARQVQSNKGCNQNLYSQITQFFNTAVNILNHPNSDQGLFAVNLRFTFILLASLFFTNQVMATEPHWGDFKSGQCLASKPGYRHYSAVLWDIPWGKSWEDACNNASADINGQHFTTPAKCSNSGSQMWGEFEVQDEQCKPAAPTVQHWGDFKADSCQKPGVRQYSAILHDIPRGTRWEDACANMRAKILDQSFTKPDRCKMVASMMWGEFDLTDTSCKVVNVPTSIEQDINRDSSWNLKDELESNACQYRIYSLRSDKNDPKYLTDLIGNGVEDVVISHLWKNKDDSFPRLVEVKNPRIDNAEAEHTQEFVIFPDTDIEDSQNTNSPRIRIQGVLSKRFLSTHPFGYFGMSDPVNSTVDKSQQFTLFEFGVLPEIKKVNPLFAQNLIDSDKNIKRSPIFKIRVGNDNDDKVDLKGKNSVIKNEFVTTIAPSFEKRYTDGLHRWNETDDVDQLFQLERVNCIHNASSIRPNERTQDNIPRPTQEKDKEFPDPKDPTKKITKFYHLKSTDSEGYPSQRTPSYVVATSRLSALVVNDPNFGDKVGQLKSSPWYELEHTQYWDYGKDRGYVTEILASAHKATRKRQTQNGFSRKELKSISETIGFEVSGQLTGKGTDSQIPLNPGQRALEANLNIAAKYSQSKTILESTENTKTEAVMVEVTDEFTSSNEKRVIVVWVLVDHFKLTDYRGNIVKEYEFVNPSITSIDEFPSSKSVKAGEPMPAPLTAGGKCNSAEENNCKKILLEGNTSWTTKNPENPGNKKWLNTDIDSLCSCTSNAASTLSCFATQIAVQGKDQKAAIDSCKAK
jgi:hypothetical protein